LTVPQAERLIALVLREVVRDDPARLALAIPALLGVWENEAAE
jgi:hypothetical protein